MPALIFLLLFPPLIEGGTTYLPVTVIRLFTIACLLTWILKGGRQGKLKVPPSGMGFPILFFAVLSLDSYFIAPYKYLAWQRLASIFDYILLLYVVIYSLNSERIKKSIYILTIFAGAEAAYGIVQALTGQPKVNGTFFNPDFYGGWLAMTAPVVLSLFLKRHSRPGFIHTGAGSGRNSATFLFVLIFVLIIVAIPFTHSRGAFLAVSFSCAVFLFFRYGWKALLPVVAVMALLLALSPFLGQKFIGDVSSDPYVYARLDIWKNAVGRIIQRPLGEGLGQYELSTFSHNFPSPDGPVRYAKVAESAHDGYLQVAAEMGIPGLLVLLWGLLVLGRAMLRAIRKEKDPTLLAAVAGLCAFLLHALFDSVFMEPGIVILALFYAGVLLKAGAEARGLAGKETPVNNTPLFKYGSVLAALLLAVYVSLPLAAWASYERYVKQKDPCGEKALKDLNLSVLLAPGNAAYHNTLASCMFNRFLNTGDPSEAKAAVSELGESVNLSRFDPYYPSRMGYVFEALSARAAPGDRVKLLFQAFVWYEKAAALAPYSPFDKMNAARMAGLLGMAGAREKLLLDALKYEPDFLPARVELARGWLSAGKTGLARAELATVEKTMALYSSHGCDIIPSKNFGADPIELRTLEDILKRKK